MIKIKGTIAHLADETVIDFATKAVRLGASVTNPGNGPLEYHFKSQLLGFTSDEVAVLCGIRGIEIEGYAAFLILPNDEYQDVISVDIANYQYLDENENMITRKWSEYKDSTHEHHEAIDDQKIIPLNGFGEELLGSDIKKLIDAGFTVVDSFTVKSYFLPQEE